MEEFMRIVLSCRQAASLDGEPVGSGDLTLCEQVAEVHKSAGMTLVMDSILSEARGFRPAGWLKANM